MIFDIHSNTHHFLKKNLVQRSDKKGFYYTVACTICGLEGKLRDKINVEVSHKIPNDLVYQCEK